MRTTVLIVMLLTLCALAAPPPATGPSRVAFDPDGILTINGERFFPIGIWLYDLNSNVMADLHEHRFNTVIGNGFGADQFDLLKQHGMMAVPFASDDFVKKVKDHPSLLAWYLNDEPEGSNKAAEAMKKAYLELKKKDANHPIGLDHFLFEALTTFKDACDFTMTDVYPITKNRDVPISHVGLFVDEARRIHGPNWPHWSYIQDFGGPDTDGGKWAQPLPHEVRCMAFDAIVHRATGIMYFSYWPKAPETWASIADLNRDLERIVPWLLAKEGKEAAAKSSQGGIHVRARVVGKGSIVIAVNVQPTYLDETIETDGRKIEDRFAPFEAKVYITGPEPGWKEK